MGYRRSQHTIHPVRFSGRDLWAAYVIEGDGGNTGMCVTSEGVILVDDEFPRDVEYILEKVKSVADQPVK